MFKLKSRLYNSQEEGVSLIEIIVAISIIAIISTASASLVINGIAAAATQERRQVAVTIASGLLETVSANGVKYESGTLTRAVDGRTPASVADAWSDNAGKLGVSTTTPESDPTVTGAPLNPIRSTITLSGTTYTSTVLIGTCHQLLTGGDCRVVTSPTAAHTQLVRIIVIVRWTPGTSCASNECFYQTFTLLDPHKDEEWVTSG